MIIDGKQITEEILNEVSQEIKKLEKPVRLVAVLVGPSTSLGQASKKFIELKRQAAEKVGIEFKMYEFPENITTQQLRKEVVSISKTRINSGILVELPLPNSINTQYVLNAIPREKDVDVLSEKAQGSFFAGRSPILPPSVEAVKIIFSAISGPTFGGENSYDLKGKNCVVFGYGLLVGKPIAHWLASQNATVSIINELTINPKRLSLQADIIISGVGKPNLITADMVKEKAIVIDFAKDVDFENVNPKASFITPPTGGVGPIVIAAVLKNLIALNQKLKGAVILPLSPQLLSGNRFRKLIGS